MKSIIQLFTISALFLVLASSNLTAREVSGSLSAGEGSSFIPSQGSAFSIISDVTSGIYGGNFNILIKSGGRIIYKERNQLDDLYLVFNEPVDDGDVIKLDVIKGVFIFKMSHMNTLPDVIVEAIKQQAPREYKQLKPLHRPIKKKRPVAPKVVTPKPVIAPKIKKVIPQQVIASPIEESRVIKRHIQPSEYKREIAPTIPVAPVIEQPEIMTPAIEKRSIPTDIAKPIIREDIIKPTETKSRIDTLSNSIDSINKKIASVINAQRKDIGVIKSDIEDVAKKSKVEAPKTSISGVSSIPLAKTFPMDIDNTLSPIGQKNTFPKTQTNIDPASQNLNIPRVLSQKDIGSFQTMIATGDVEKPKFQTSTPDFMVKKIKIQEKISKPKMEVVKTVPAPTIEQEDIKYVQPEIIAPPVVQEIIVPKIIEKPIVRSEIAKDRIIITKTIANQEKKKVQKEEPRVIKRHVQPQNYRDQEEQIPQRMSERVMGNGYGLATSGKIKVKAYSNNRAISAWVEVFNAGTNQRVKTFYTGKGKSLKDVKLPAGTYVIKATYRTAGSKRKKTIGRVTLEEGESINKSISFNDGSIKVKVKKSGNPIYAKVEVFKSGKKRRIAYEFSSKITGVANLSLGSGKYDIVVKDHGDVQRFDSITVKGGKSKTINVDF